MCRWKPVTGSVPQESILGPVLFNMFISTTDNESEDILGKFAGDNKLCGGVDSVQRRSIQRDLKRLEKLMKFSKAKLKAGLDVAMSKRL